MRFYNFFFFFPELIEVILPAANPLNTQFSSRPVCIVGDVDDKKLNSVYWLSLPTCDDSDQEMDQVSMKY